MVYIDSQSVLTALCSLYIAKHGLVRKVHQFILATLQAACITRLCWVPIHIGIPGHENADQLAHTSRDPDEIIADLPYQELYSKVISLIQKEWQSQRRLGVVNKLLLVKPFFREVAQL